MQLNTADGSVELIVSEDKMKASIKLTKKEDTQVSEKFVLEHLARNKVVYGVKLDVIKRIIEKGLYNMPVVVAEGLYPQPGKNGEIEFYFDISDQVKPQILEDGRVDYKQLNIVRNVNKGQKLARIIEPIQGIPGRNVLGTEISVPVAKPAPNPRGKNVELSEDKSMLYAAIDGQVDFSSYKISVNATYEVQGDVGNSTGNISFIGNVLVTGNVLSGFAIMAGGSVEVLGSVEAALIKAETDIIIRRGMQGQGKGRLISGRDVIARYIENSIIEVVGDIKSEAIMNSNIKCGSKVELSGNKGLLVGGTVRARKLIDAKVIGSPMTTITEIELGLDPMIKERVKIIKQEFTKIEQDLYKINQIIDMLQKLKEMNKLAEEKEEFLNKSLSGKEFLSNKQLQLLEEQEHLNNILKEETFSKVKVSGTIYSGTKIIIGDTLYKVEEDLQHCSLFKENDEIKLGSYI